MRSAYIHIPFCNNICNYCGFCKFFYNEDWVNKYLVALKKEVEEVYEKDKIYTLYIGGGTPSCLNIKELKELFKITKLLDLSELAEFSFECNIEDITEEKLKLLKENKVNRLSIGIQTFNKDRLKELGRSIIDIDSKINLAKKYFDNINVDIMYALFNESIDDLKEDLKHFLNLKVNHISCYSLMIEPHTRFYDKKEIDEELDYEMYNLINKTLKDNNYIHYEVSNYAKIGFESKHNLMYWSNNEYYGFGVSASSYINNKRSTNTKNIIGYINNVNPKEVEIVNKKDKMKYELILGLRKINGVNKKDFFDKYKIDIYDAFDLNNLIDNKYIIDDGKNIFINENFIYISNEILINFI